MAQNKIKNRENLKIKSNLLPKKPGCYKFYNENEEILYVGKAKNLRSRVSSYFNSEHKGAVKTQFLIQKITDIKVELTATEAEAFVLENQLIKKYLRRLKK